MGNVINEIVVVNGCGRGAEEFSPRRRGARRTRTAGGHGDGAAGAAGERLEDKAERLETADIPDFASVQLDDVTSTADLAAAILKHPSDDGSSAAEVLSWAALCDTL
jgi:hypothetical protein